MYQALNETHIGKKKNGFLSTGRQTLSQGVSDVAAGPSQIAGGRATHLENQIEEESEAKWT